MKKMLPVLAALFLVLLVLPSILVIPVQAATPTTPNGAKLAVVTIPEDDKKRNTGVMVLGLAPTATKILSAGSSPDGLAHWYTDAACSTAVDESRVVGAEVNDEPVSAGTVVLYYKATVQTGAPCVKRTFLDPREATFKPYDGVTLLSQHKILVTLGGVPTTPDGVSCEVIEKEKLKNPPQSDKTPTVRQFPQEVIETKLVDVTKYFVCKYREIKPGVGVLDVYFVGPILSNFIADHMLIVSAYKKVGYTTMWASDIQDICILGWSMSPGLAFEVFTGEYFVAWIDPLADFSSCEYAALTQLAWIEGGWPALSWPSA